MTTFGPYQTATRKIKHPCRRCLEIIERGDIFYYGAGRPIHFDCSTPNKLGYATKFNCTIEDVKLWSELTAPQKEKASSRWPHATEDYIFHVRMADDYVLFCQLL